MRNTRLAAALLIFLGAASAAPTPAEIGIHAAREAIARDPKSAQAYSDLAMALSRRARETSDAAYYIKAEDAVRKALEIQPGSFEAEKVRVWIHLGKHEFTAAREKAIGLNRQAPDDIQVYGFLVDASAELGRYEEAEEAAQWMLDLRPGSVAALTRAAYLREIFGDLDGATDLMNQAYTSVPFAESEDRAWVLSHIGHLHCLAGKLDAAERVLQEALKTFPNYHYALGTLAAVRIAQGRSDEAVGLLRTRYRNAPHSENLFALAEALVKAGYPEEAKEAYAQFEVLARKEVASEDNANRELIAYYAGPGSNPREALRLAEIELSRRHDVYTRTAHAAALRANGRLSDAAREMKEVLSIGIRDPRVLDEARAALGGM